ncbi:hypothetical protein GCM10011348_01740 [Marinobacterium nitratireducens]|uniref:Transmembrane protein n=1 Tax=Marinobacterium nitratireducens TaxID=518897 RepID=A0A918DMY8_9GAMM|nr:hypothetical protein [Marinobacterium nitratireducens]GGO75886.1 hypothetical protein GCM10011348_01740 [Marinobacterium nitratireducens]
MSRDDRHGTRRISRIAATLVALFFAAIGVVGYQRTGDSGLLLAFLVMAPVGFGLVTLLFRGVDWVLDSLDRRR